LTKFYTATELGERQVLGSTSPPPSTHGGEVHKPVCTEYTLTSLEARMYEVLYQTASVLTTC